MSLGKAFALFLMTCLIGANFAQGFAQRRGRTTLSSSRSRGLAPTPPMGWNSWDSYGPSVTEREVKANADYIAKHLKR